MNLYRKESTYISFLCKKVIVKIETKEKILFLSTKSLKAILIKLLKKKSTFFIFLFYFFFFKEFSIQLDTNQKIFGIQNLKIGFTPCPEKCSKCTSDTTCVACEDKAYLYNQLCLEKCPSGTYSSTEFICNKCNSNCKECEN